MPYSKYCSSFYTPSVPPTPTPSTIALPLDKIPTKADFPSGSMDPPVAIALVDQYTSKASKTSELHTAGLMGLPVPSGPIALTLSGPNLAEI